MGTLNPTHSVTHLLSWWLDERYVCRSRGDGRTGPSPNFGVVSCYTNIDVSPRPQIRKFIGVTRSLRLFHFRTGGREWRKECRDKRSLQKRSQPAESIKNDNAISQRIYRKSLHMSEKDNNLQLVLNNVPIRSVFEQ